MAKNTATELTPDVTVHVLRENGETTWHGPGWNTIPNWRLSAKPKRDVFSTSRSSSKKSLFRNWGSDPASWTDFRRKSALERSPVEAPDCSQSSSLKAAYRLLHCFSTPGYPVRVPWISFQVVGLPSVLQLRLDFNDFDFEGLCVSAQECQALGYAANFQLNFKILIPAWILNGSPWAESENPEKTDDVR